MIVTGNIPAKLLAKHGKTQAHYDRVIVQMARDGNEHMELPDWVADIQAEMEAPKTKKKTKKKAKKKVT
jgi:hypothetical protein